MDRRKSLKTILVSGVSVGAVLNSCTTNKEGSKNLSAVQKDLYRTPSEIKKIEEILAKGKFFDNHETETLTLLADIIIPKDEHSGSASEAKVVEFIDFIVQDIPDYQLGLQGGLKWLDQFCYNQYGLYFNELSKENQIKIIDLIAYPDKALPENSIGVTFFNTLRDLVVTGFYTSAIGYKDLNYIGNAPNRWNGVPPDVLREHGLAYTTKELKECLSFD